jgi:hypothetical protein
MYFASPQTYNVPPPPSDAIFDAMRGCYEVSLHELEKYYLGNIRKTNTFDKKEEVALQQQLLWKRLQVTTATPINDITTLPPIMRLFPLVNSV